jgi:hypothetical protein
VIRPRTPKPIIILANVDRLMNQFMTGTPGARQSWDG